MSSTALNSVYDKELKSDTYYQEIVIYHLRYSLVMENVCKVLQEFTPVFLSQHVHECQVVTSHELLHRKCHDLLVQVNILLSAKNLLL